MMNSSDRFVETYLNRICAEPPKELTPQSLMELTRAHLEHVPFEVLEMTEAHTEPSLEPEGLYQKIVACRRGGYCFELNKLFYLLLKELGFTCHPVGVRVLMGRPEPRAISHRGIVVAFGREKWYCDVGFGGRGPKGILCLESTIAWGFYTLGLFLFLQDAVERFVDSYSFAVGSVMGTLIVTLYMADFLQSVYKVKKEELPDSLGELFEEIRAMIGK